MKKSVKEVPSANSMFYVKNHGNIMWTEIERRVNAYDDLKEALEQSTEALRGFGSEDVEHFEKILERAELALLLTGKRQ